MKRNLLKILPFLLLGGVLGLAAAPAAFEAAETSAETTFPINNYQDFGGSAVSGWDITPQSKYCGLYYSNGKNGSFTVTNKTISDFSVFASGTYSLKVYVSGICNSGTNSVSVGMVNSSGIAVGDSQNVTGKLGGGSDPKNAKETPAFTFTPSISVTGLKIELGNKCALTKVRWNITKVSDDDPEPEKPATYYTKVTDAATLQVGQTIVLGCEAEEAVAGPFSANILSGKTAVFEDNKLYSNDAEEITLAGTSGAWKLLTSLGQLGTTESGKFNLTTDTTWTISITDSVASITTEDYGTIQYNAGAPRFVNYTSTQTPIEIYTKDGEIASYSVSYDANGGGTGSITDADSPYNKASAVTVLANTFTPITGKTFVEWNTKADGTGTSYKAGDTFLITADTTLYAIWEDEYIPIGDSYTKVTSTTDLALVSEFLFVFQSGETVKANGGLEGSDHFAAYDAKILDGELTYNNDKIVPLTLEKENNAWLIKSESGYLTLTFNASNKLAWKTKANANRWSISFSSGNVVVTSSIDGVNHSIFYNGSGTGRFSNYSSSTMSPVQMWAKTGHAKEVHLSVDSLDLNVAQKGIVTVSECIGFEPSSYLWEITSGDDVISIYSGQGTKEILVEALKEGEAEIYVTVDGVKATCAVTVHDYKYNILDKDNYYITTGGAMLGGDTSYISEVDFSDATNMWHFEKAYEGDNSYYLTANDKYLAFSEDVYEDGKNISEIQLSDTPVNVWVVTYSESNGYKVATQTKKQGVRSLAIHEEQWFAFTGNNYVDLLEGGTFDHYAVEALPTTKQYFVGDELKPLNSHVYAYYTNGFKAEITNKIEWETLTEGTKAYGTCEILGAEVDIEMDGLKIYKGDASTFVINGLHDTYSIGERINKDNLTVGITYKLSGSEDIVKDSLAKDDYTISPEKIVEGTEKIRIALAKDPTVYYEQDIEVKESSYVAASHIKEGDKIILGTLGYNPYEITGGKELSYTGDKFSYETFDYMPRGEMPLEVGKEGSYFTLKDPVTGYYLRGDNSAITFNEPDYKSVYAEGDGHYELNLSVTIGGTSIIAEMKTTLEPDFADPMVFSSMTYVGGYEDYVVGTSHLDENKFTFYMWSKKNNYEEVYATAEVEIADWKFTGGAFYYALEISSTLPEECLFTMNYDEDFEEWVVSSKPHQDRQLYFNKDGKFGFYPKGSSYTPVMVFRDNDLPLQSEPTSVSVSFTPIEGTDPQEYMNTVTVGEQFPWTSALVVKVNYGGGASKVIPVGGYTIKQMPDTSEIGPSTGIISYGQNGHQIDKEFTIIVKGKTQSFTVICQSPIRVGETLQAHLENGYEPPEGEPITWSVSDPTLASIDQDGNVTGLKAGYVNVIATSFDGTYSSSKKVQIFQNVVSLSLDKTEMTLEAGKTTAIVATVLPTDASNPSVLWSSEDNNIASVNSKGEVTGLSVGTTTIICKTQGKPFDSEEPLTETCKVTVTPGSVVRVTGVSLSSTTKDIEVGASATLTAIITPSNATEQGVTWESKYDEIVSVDKNGKITGKKKGTSDVTVKTLDGGFTATCRVTVKENVQPVPVTSISLDTTNKKIDINEEFILTATINPIDADDKYIEWSSTDDSVATVTYLSQGKATVKGLRDGEATITARTNNGKSATCKVTVGNPVPPVISVDSVSLNKTSINLIPGDESSLVATVNPSNATNKNVSWSSSNENVASVNTNGRVTAVAAGEAIITVTTEDGEKTATCKVTVEGTPTPIVNVSSVSLNKTETTLGVNETEKLVATISPENATNKNVTWSTSNSGVVTVDQNGNISGVAKGEAFVMVKTEDGGKTALCKVTVQENPSPVVHVESVTLDKTEVELAKGTETVLIPTINPVTSNNKKVTWASSDTSIATVDQMGKVTAVEIGEATITVTTEDGAKTATCKIIVIKAETKADPTPVIIGVSCGVGAVGIGCGVGIPLGVRAFRKRKLH